MRSVLCIDEKTEPWRIQRVALTPLFAECFRHDFPQQHCVLPGSTVRSRRIEARDPVYVLCWDRTFPGSGQKCPPKIGGPASGGPIYVRRLIYALGGYAGGLMRLGTSRVLPRWPFSSAANIEVHWHTFLLLIVSDIASKFSVCSAHIAYCPSIMYGTYGE